MTAPKFKFPEKKSVWENPASSSQTDPSQAEKKTDANAGYLSSGNNDSLKLFDHSKSTDDGESIWLLSYSDLMTMLFSFFVMLMSFSKIDTEAFEKTRKVTTELFGGEYKRPHAEMLDKLKKEIQQQGLTEKTFFKELENGIVLTFRGSIFFDAGSAEIKAEALGLLKKVMPIVKTQSSRYKVIVEGHTDDSPISTAQFPSNWELSSQRATAVLRLFEQGGFERTHLRAMGYADTLPVVPNRDKADTPIVDNQSQNRRVVIKLLQSAE